MKRSFCTAKEYFDGYFFAFRNVFRSCLTTVSVILMVSAVAGGCTLKSTPVPNGAMPEYRDLTIQEQAFGRKLYEKLGKDYRIDKSHRQYAQLLATFDNLVRATGADRSDWQLHLYNMSEVVDVRAVHGNFIFVWSGFLDFAENEDEIAAVLACEIAHILARHTKPVQFTILSEFLFGTAEIATSIGIMFLSQGIVSVGGQGWMKHVYTEAVDLDPLDREYSEEEVREALAIALLLLDRSGYAPEAMLTFWKRVQEGPVTQDRKVLLNRSVPLRKRIALLEEILLDHGQTEEPITLSDDPLSDEKSLSK